MPTDIENSLLALFSQPALTPKPSLQTAPNYCFRTTDQHRAVLDQSGPARDRACHVDGSPPCKSQDDPFAGGSDAKAYEKNGKDFSSLPSHGLKVRSFTPHHCSAVTPLAGPRTSNIKQFSTRKVCVGDRSVCKRSRHKVGQTKLLGSAAPFPERFGATAQGKSQCEAQEQQLSLRFKGHPFHLSNQRRLDVPAGSCHLQRASPQHGFVAPASHPQLDVSLTLNSGFR